MTLPRGWGARLGLAAALACLALGGAELALRILDLGQVMVYRADPRFGYGMVPGQRISTYGELIETNALGLRGPELRTPKPADELRLIFTGNSISYGGGHVAESQLFCRVIEQLAAADGLRVESVNVSVPGWSPRNWAGWLEANGTLDADLIVPVISALDLRLPFTSMAEVGVVDHAPLLRLGSLWVRWKARQLPNLPLSDESEAANVAALRALESHFPGVPFQAVFLEARPGDDPRPSYWAPFETLFPDAIDLRHTLGAEWFVDEVHFGVPGHAEIARQVWAGLAPRLRALAAGRVGAR
jgi:hypothetical protein